MAALALVRDDPGPRVPFQLPELGPIGSSTGLASARHFQAPKAAFEDSVDGAVELVSKFQGNLPTDSGTGTCHKNFFTVHFIRACHVLILLKS